MNSTLGTPNRSQADSSSILAASTPSAAEDGSSNDGSNGASGSARGSESGSAGGRRATRTGSNSAPKKAGDSVSVFETECASCVLCISADPLTLRRLEEHSSGLLVKHYSCLLCCFVQRVLCDMYVPRRAQRGHIRRQSHANDGHHYSIDMLLVSTRLSCRFAPYMLCLLLDSARTVASLSLSRLTPVH